MKFKFNYLILVFLLALLTIVGNSQNPVKNTAKQDEKIQKLIKSLPERNEMRSNLEEGKRGYGEHYDWMTEMKSLGIKHALFVFRVDKRNDMELLNLYSVTYYTGYYERDKEIKDEKVLDKLNETGLGLRLKLAAEAEAQEILSLSSFDNCGKVLVQLLDDESLPVSDFMAQYDYKNNCEVLFR